MNRILTTLACALLIASSMLPARAAAPACSNTAVTLTEDYTYFIGSSDVSDPDGDDPADSAFRWVVNGTTLQAGAVGEGLLLHFDNSVLGASGEAPVDSNRVAFTAGRWGPALELPTNGLLAYACADNLRVDEGTIEMWVALQTNGGSAVYTGDWQVLFHYRATNDDWMVIAHDGNSGILYAGGTVSSEWQSAWGSRASTRAWSSGEWHHVAYTYSATGNFMRFYMDGALAADSNEGHYWAPDPSGVRFSVGSDIWGNAARYRIDEFRACRRVFSADEIAVRACRTAPPRANERWLDADLLALGDTVAYEFTPVAGADTGAPCTSATTTWNGIPITNPVPPSTLLAPGTTGFVLSVNTRTNTDCRYAMDDPLPYGDMTPFDAGAGTTLHETALSGIDPDPAATHHVYVRCATDTNYLLHLKYRCVAAANPRFPRTGNLWGWWNFEGKPSSEVARIDLWLGADGLGSNQLRQLREMNTNVYVLMSINAVEWGDGLPGDWYLLDTNGDRVLVWTGSYRLNVTKTNVAEFLAEHAVQEIVNSDLMYDGCFFDNVFLSQSWLTEDMYGDPFESDYDEDGEPDDDEAFDAAWRAGVLHELATFRDRMPYALASCHAVTIFDDDITNLFNGISFGFLTADVLERETSYADLGERYGGWMTRARPPHITMFESSPGDDIAYGYDYEPLEGKVTTSALAFAESHYPYVRFGLAATLMDDGYFAHEFGDMWHGNAWWYDELDHDLGYPLGPAESLGETGTNQVENNGFEDPIVYPWSFWCSTGDGCTATLTRVTDEAAEGAASARIEVTAASGTDWHIDLSEYTNSLDEGVTYEVLFQAKADRSRPMGVYASKNKPDWRGYGLWRQFTLTTNWTEYTALFEANETAADARLQFMFGQTNGTVWLDDVSLRTAAPNHLRREFDHGLVLLNATWEPWTYDPGPGWRRLTGSQAPRHEYVIDDADTAFSATGTWNVVTNDSGEWTAVGPFYHDWGPSCRRSGSTSSVARWDLAVPETDTYTVHAWWPALPDSGWSQDARFEIVTGATVLASASFNQRTNGDTWNVVGQVALAAGAAAFVRLQAQDADPCIADGVYVTSAARYNDGSDVTNVTLQSMDGIILQRQPGWHADRDGDGMPDFWEEAYFGGPTNATATADDDIDGVNNLGEWLGGTHPFNAASYFKVDGIRTDPAPGASVIQWPSISDRVYDVESSAGGVDAFGLLTSELPATPTVNVYTDREAYAVSQVFYRVRARK